MELEGDYLCTKTWHEFDNEGCKVKYHQGKIYRGEGIYIIDEDGIRRVWNRQEWLDENFMSIEGKKGRMLKVRR